MVYVPKKDAMIEIYTLEFKQINNVYHKGLCSFKA